MIHSTAVNRIFLYILLIIINHYAIESIYAQDTLWTKTYGLDNWDIANSIDQTTDNGFIIAGYTSSFDSTNYNILAIKTNDIGDTVWMRIYPFFGCQKGHSVYQTSDNGFIIAGSSSRYSNNDSYLVKANSSGEIEWNSTWRLNRDNAAYYVVEAADGGYATVGYKYLGPHPDYGIDILLIKYDSLGTPIWDRSFGGGEKEIGYCIQQTSDLGFIICGLEHSYGPDRDKQDFYLLKTDSLGRSQWYEDYDNDDNYETAKSVKQLDDGGYIVVGYSSNSITSDIFVVRVDEEGNEIWTNTYGGSASDFASDVEITEDGGFIISGYTTSYEQGWYDALIIRVDSDGSVLWTRTYCTGLATAAYSLTQTNDGYFALAGECFISEESNWDIWIAKISDCNTDIIDLNPFPQKVSVYNNYPNPFNTATTIQFDLNTEDYVNLEVFNVKGQKIKILINESRNQGKHTIYWNASSYSSGIYFYKLTTGDKSFTKRMTLLK